MKSKESRIVVFRSEGAEYIGKALDFKEDGLSSFKDVLLVGFAPSRGAGSTTMVPAFYPLTLCKYPVPVFRARVGTAVWLDDLSGEEKEKIEMSYENAVNSIRNNVPSRVTRGTRELQN